MIKILIVDDEKPICDLIDLNLSAAGYFCKSVQDGMKAIECIEREKFDLILLDIMLPGVDGFDIMEYIRPLKIPVIFITARGDVKDRVKGLRLGAEDYLVKPFMSWNFWREWRSYYADSIRREHSCPPVMWWWIWMPEW